MEDCAGQFLFNTISSLKKLLKIDTPGTDTVYHMAMPCCKRSFDLLLCAGSERLDG